MTSYNLGTAPFSFFHSTLHHLMGHRTCKQNEQIRASHLFIQICRHMCEYLRLMVIILAYFLILGDHPVMSAYNYDTHNSYTCLYTLAKSLPKSIHASCAASFGASLQIVSSPPITFAPAFSISSTQRRIHSPSPHP